MIERISNENSPFAAYTSPIMRKHTKLEGFIMTVEKFIRILGYIVYVALWSPVIVLIAIMLPVWVLIKTKSLSLTCTLLKMGFKSGIAHDMEFINTGVWY